ncbi:hypothetical protein [Pseudomonas sp. Sample_22]|uniref:hypothetical protein n=1 Tax=Pseudomonas sp. Sample_22 TaxID=2448266 RepID=UPI0010328359|nr:hypothetical protein [Pseudomonas sp. Sample_22]
MVTLNSTQRFLAPPAPKPEVIGLIEDVLDGEPGLVPVALTGDNLKVWFTIPLYSDPDVGEETYELFVDDKTDAIATRKWTTPIEDSDRYLELPRDWMRNNDGQHRIYYTTKIYNDAENRSLELVITLDTRAPDLPSGDDSKLIFPPEVAPPPIQITAAYLADPANEDRVLATLPDYTEKKVGDVITWYWERSPGGREIVDTVTLARDDLGKPVQVAFKGDLLRRANGEFYASYRVRDRAGNETGLSQDIELSVNIRPPTPRKFPTVKQAESAPNGTGVLNPFRGIAGVTVVVEGSEVDPGEEVTVDFIGLGGEGGIGSVTGVKPVPPGGLEFAIPAPFVAANIPVGGDGRKVEVRYWAGRDVQHSAVYTLSISEFTAEAFGAVMCPEAQIGSPATLSKNTVALSGANIDIEKWAYHEGTQKINVWAMASGVRTDFLKDAPTPLNADGRFRTPLPKAYVASLPLNSTFTLYASVSFDQGHSYRPFKSMSMKLVT